MAYQRPLKALYASAHSCSLRGGRGEGNRGRERGKGGVGGRGGERGGMGRVEGEGGLEKEREEE